MNLGSVGMTQNRSPDVTVEDSGVFKAKKDTPSFEQGESDVDSFL
jgi:hypothetical protein